MIRTPEYDALYMNSLRLESARGLHLVIPMLPARSADYRTYIRQGPFGSHGTTTTTVVPGCSNNCLTLDNNSVVAYIIRVSCLFTACAVGPIFSEAEYASFLFSR